MPNLTDRIANLIHRLRPPTPDTTTYERLPSTAMGFAAHLGEARTRREVVEACNRMYKDDTRAKAVVDRVADGAVRRGFTLAVAPVGGTANTAAETAQAILDALAERTEIKRRAHRYLRRAFNDGELFLQIAIDSRQQIAKLAKMPALEMHRNSDELDEFDDPRFAYWQAPRHSTFSYVQTPPMHEQAGVTWFADWQIVHARWDHDEGERHGTPLLASARRAFKRFREGEADMFVRRKTRAGMRRHHKLKSSNYTANGPGGESLAGIEAYKRANRDSLSNPLAATGDYFTTGDAEIDILQGDAHLGDIADVLHHLDAFFAVSPLPMALIGYGRDLNRDVLRDQYAAYLRALDEIAEWFENQVLRPLFELELLLHGILPASVSISVQWAEKQDTPLTVDDLVKLAPFVTQATWLKLLQKVVPGFDARAEIDALEAEEADDANLRLPGDVDALLQTLQSSNGKAREVAR